MSNRAPASRASAQQTGRQAGRRIQPTASPCASPSVLQAGPGPGESLRARLSGLWVLPLVFKARYFGGLGPQVQVLI